MDYGIKDLKENFNYTKNITHVRRRVVYKYKTLYVYIYIYSIKNKAK